MVLLQHPKNGSIILYIKDKVKITFNRSYEYNDNSHFDLQNVVNKNILADEEQKMEWMSKNNNNKNFKNLVPIFASIPFFFLQIEVTRINSLLVLYLLTQQIYYFSY